MFREAADLARPREDSAVNLRSRKNRIISLFAFIEFCFIILIINLFIIQYIKSKDYQQRAHKQFRIISKAKIKRGTIYSRNMSELAINRDMISVWVDPSVIEDPQNIANELAPLFGCTSEKLLTLLNQKDRRFVWLNRKLDYGILRQVYQRLDMNKIYGLGILVEEKRFYPKGNLASHVIGCINFDNEGLDGVEKSYDAQVTSYYEETQPLSKDGKNRIIKPGVNDNEIPNYNHGIVLTIDEVVQDITEEELNNACEKCSAQSGIAIVMNPKTGEIIALANYPSYDLNLYSKTEDINKRNLAIWAAYEPGSVFKIVTISAALEEKVVKPSDTIYCEWGRYRVFGKTIHDDSSYGSLTVSEVISKSSNIGVTKIANRLGKDKFDKYVRAFGFGKRTNIDLPYEAQGNISALDKWGKRAMFYLPWGQGIAVTPLQMLSAMNVIANNGILMKPYVVKEIIDDQGNVIKTIAPQPERQVISSQTAQTVTQMMIGVVTSGTGKKAQIKDYQVAGKTGTAQKAGKGGYSARKYIAFFLGFLPAEDAKLSIIVVIDEPQGQYHGGSVSAPVFKAIAEKAMKLVEAHKVAMDDSK
ncbi:penicillin-binding protein 2 [Candidatus Poribacteria bacterium]|nr:penicillin-binding protein 2 [Candidatus Poribacteria bacterium]